MIRGEYEETFSVTMKLVDQPQYGGFCLVERWRTKNGLLYRPGDLPSTTAYDPNTGRILQQEWTQKNGKYGVRPGNKPSIIATHEKQPEMVWFGEDGSQKFIAEPTDIIRDPETNEIIEFVYEAPPSVCGPEKHDLPVPSLDIRYTI